MIISSPKNIRFVLNENISFTLTAKNGTPPYKWEVLNQLPEGLILNTNTGVISGIPISTGIKNVKIRVKDRKLKKAIKNFNIQVRSELDSYKSLYVCGNNSDGQLGDGTSISRSVLSQSHFKDYNWKQVSIGAYNAAGVKNNGTLWVWGNYAYGGNGDNIPNPTPYIPHQNTTNGNNWDQVSCGGIYFSGGIKTDGTLWMWGQNVVGSLGDNTTINRSSAVQTIAGGTDWKQISCGAGHSTAIKTDGTLWMWGQNNHGQLGDNTIINKSSPVQTICGGNDWKDVFCGINFTAAIKNDGTLWLWGQNNYGQLGDNSSESKSSPIQTIAGDVNWKQISCGETHSAAIKTDGTLWVWGGNRNGALGLGNIDYPNIKISSPVQTIAKGNNWIDVACGSYHTVAIKNSNTNENELYSFGYNINGQLGLNSTQDVYLPTKEIKNKKNWLKVYASINTTFALSNDLPIV